MQHAHFNFVGRKLIDGYLNRFKDPATSALRMTFCFSFWLTKCRQQGHRVNGLFGPPVVWHAIFTCGHHPLRIFFAGDDVKAVSAAGNPPKPVTSIGVDGPASFIVCPVSPVMLAHDHSVVRYDEVALLQRALLNEYSAHIASALFDACLTMGSYAGFAGFARNSSTSA